MKTIFVSSTFKDMQLERDVIQIVTKGTRIVYIVANISEMFYGASEEGKYVLSVMAITSIFFSLQLVINMILQGMKNFKIKPFSGNSVSHVPTDN